ncbi:MAG: NADH-quinone oxidoreductase subunit C [Chlorobiaceae bacterium]|nr:NADH-quinone oxidoreductase subunit C [Chlorobiaceae bacterium]MBA4310255.1 NADH-quinone oxidoreductase subunit C [Chlorobiaceae bacterium]
MQTILEQSLQTKFPEIKFVFSEYKNLIEIKFDKKYLTEVALFLKDDPRLSFSMCEDLTAIDWATSNNRFSMIYILFSLSNKFRIKLKVDLEEGEKVDSISAIWNSANWAERETYDMFGIEFNNHPDLRRMYMPEEFEYHPLRKEFPVMGIPGSLSLPK